ncbi:DUF2742 domain-containing protein [Mycolicibacterium aichiense]|uniref:DUF2742 domain-containing protein n=1 Tax=Mycolicibacterium aichiense TaxID=1799 RepID=UPI003D670CB9
MPAQVDFFAVSEFVKPYLDAAGAWPMVGSRAWVELPDDSPVKWAALLSAAEHWALKIELNQDAIVQASQAISGAAPWAQWSRDIRQRHDAIKSGAYIKRVPRDDW